MASTSSSAAVAAMAQRASEQYIACRRNVTAKVNEVKLLEEQMSAVFQQITALSEAPEGQEELSEEAKARSKSVGRLEVTLVGVEGEEPVPNATITVSLDPEYETDEYEIVEEVVEKKDVVMTDEHGNVVEKGQVSEKDNKDSPRKLKTTTKITRTIIKKRVKKEKAPAVRTIAWTAAITSEEGTGETDTLTFPATFVFDPVQSREAVVIVTVAAAKEEEEAEPVKEIEFSISSLFQDNVLDKWYSTADEEEEEVPTTITEIVEETVLEVNEEKTTAEEVEEAEVQKTQKAEEMEKEEIVEEIAAAVTTSDEVEQAEKALKTKDVVKTEEAVKTEETEKADEAEKVKRVIEVEQAEKADEAEKVKRVIEVEQAEKADKVEVSKPAGSCFHVKANLVLSEAEKLSIAVVALSKKKQEAEAALLVLEREAASLRTKHDRLNASQRQLTGISISKPNANLLGGRFGAGMVSVQRKSWYQSSRERTTAFIRKHQQLLVSVAMFGGSVCLFHFNGENLLA
ncbi:unnamed protein product [Peronospora destructor]|uniref:Uncharacterized protein n=1 Tax=Peronospora destructor TaxID=86335 RepID=A0AAV0U9J2_9STRA|nr:unnamed protein product [Peronospora destructor]